MTIDELLSLVTIALGEAPVEGCCAGDGDGNGQIAVDEVVAAVNAALDRCG